MTSGLSTSAKEGPEALAIWDRVEAACCASWLLPLPEASGTPIFLYPTNHIDCQDSFQPTTQGCCDMGMETEAVSV